MGVAAGAALAALPAWAEPKIGIVDAPRLMEESPQGKAVADAMRAEFAPRRANAAGAGAGAEGQGDKLQKDGATMTEEQRQRAEKELRDGQRDFERARGEFQDDVNARRNEELSRLQRTLVEEVRTYAKAQNFDLVLNSEGVCCTRRRPTTSPPGVLAALQAHAAAAGQARHRRAATAGTAAGEAACK